MTWTAVLADLDGEAYGELRDASSRRWKRVLNRPRTVSWTARADNPLIVPILSLDTTLAKFYEDGSGTNTLRFVGPIVSYEKQRDAQGGTVAVVAQDAFWRLGHRLIGKSAAGFTQGDVLRQVDKGQIASGVLAAANASGDTGIRMGTIETSSNGYAGPWRYKQADQAIAELSATMGGFDWDVAPVEPVADLAGVQIGALNVYTEIGSVKPDVIFEFGTGRHNVSSWRDVGDATALANSIFNLPPGFPEDTTQGVIAQQDSASIDSRGLHEALVSADLIVDVLRQALVSEHLQIRRVPRRVITFQPIAEDPSGADPATQRLPRLFTDYDVGDIVQFRCVERIRTVDATGAVTGYAIVTTVDAAFRIFGAEVEIDDAGQATPSLVLVQE